eukprot:1158256-Pelagomonas_calceolata.AAC.16
MLHAACAHPVSVPVNRYFGECAAGVAHLPEETACGLEQALGCNPGQGQGMHQGCAGSSPPKGAVFLLYSLAFKIDIFALRRQGGMSASGNPLHRYTLAPSSF